MTLVCVAVEVSIFFGFRFVLIVLLFTQFLLLLKYIVKKVKRFHKTYEK